jgi:type II secretory pathway pseudopilin PulG
MKLSLKRCAADFRRKGFTISEFMVATVVVMMVLGGVMGTYLYGLRTVEFVKPKLDASEEGRKAISLLLHEVRSAHLLRIGNGSLSTFVEVPPNTLQQGSAIEINPTTNQNDFVRYFWDAGDERLKRTTDGATATQVIANSVTNRLVFTAEDFSGRVLTNNFNNRVIGLTLQFSKSQGLGTLRDSYQLRTKITRRTIL